MSRPVETRSSIGLRQSVYEFLINVANNQTGLSKCRKVIEHGLETKANQGYTETEAKKGAETEVKKGCTVKLAFWCIDECSIHRVSTSLTVTAD